MTNSIYQVVVTDPQNHKVLHVAFFRLHAYAIACMNEVHALFAGKGLVVSVWQNTLFEVGWDGNLNVREELTRDLN